ncbi:metal-dependent hydrolase [Kineosporia babensis]|uniref:Metal-dependent hydrolase n=1 Tax=Kineosporia babensis TaxID=499548 RepID=A0A9X1NBW7_9ACTN|nr:metal-dependent hydrolase [Kineosporia babensis]MCD5310845.1 metal-dependent hydrolase [Kineosporia babensis]
MTKTHAPCGSLAGLLAALALDAVTDPRPAVVFALVGGATAGALLPDTDHHSSSPARMWGRATQIPCAWIGRLAGGHREWTHDVSRGAPLAFAAAFGACLVAPLLAAAAGAWHWLDVLSDGLGAVAIALVTGLALIGVDAWLSSLPTLGRRRLRIDTGTNAVVSWLTALAVVGTYPGGLPATVIAAIVVGVLIGVPAGIAGDACTLSGVPWRGRDRHLLPYGWRIRTGSAVEAAIRVPILIAVTVLAWVLAGHPGAEVLADLQAQ